ncbi:MAG: sulfatase [Gemmatimonadota bacterium]|nr:sulfatase [Gemmatimonadota bacterium]
MSPGTVSRGEVLLAAASLGLLAGLIEAALVVGRWMVAPAIQFQSTDVVWLAPLADLLLLLLVGLLLVLTQRLLSRTSAAILLLTAASWLVLLHADQLHWAAQGAIAAGLGIQLGRWLAQRHRWWAGLPRQVMSLLLLVGLLCGGERGWRLWREHRMAGELPAGPPGAPNVLLVVLDATRRDHLSLYGYDRPTTPVLAELAARGTSFTQAMSVAPWTLPSHASMFTGLLPHEVTATWKVPLDGAAPTVAEVLSRRGYRTGLFTGNINYVSWETGLTRGFARFRDYRIGLGRLVMAPALGRLLLPSQPDQWRLLRNSAGQVNESFLQWLDDSDPAHPFFACLNYFDAHDPYEPPPPFDTLFAPGSTVAERAAVTRRAMQRWKAPDWTLGLAQYDGAIRYMDTELGALQAALGRRGLLEHTVIIVTADHGEHMGEHGLVEHGNSLYRPLLDVPLVIAVPGQAAARSDVPVSLRDLARTITTLAGGESGPVLPGHSLLETGRSGSEPLYAELDFVPQFRKKKGPIARGPMWAVQAEGHRLIRQGDQSEQLFDVALDAAEVNDLATVPARTPIHRALQARLDSVARSGDIINSGMRPIPGGKP